MVSGMPERTNPTAEDLLKPSEAAAMLGVTVRSVARYADLGQLACIRPGGHRRYSRADVERLKKGSAA